MKVSRILIALAVTASLGLAACGGGGGSSSIPTKSGLPNGGSPTNGANNGNSAIPSSLQIAWQSQVMANATLVGAADPRTTVSMNVAVKMQNPKGLLAYSQQVSTPGSGAYRHFLTPTQIANQFAASASDYSAAAAYLQADGLHVSGWPQREVLAVTGALGNFSRAFNTTFAVYKSGGQTFVAPSGTPHLSSAVPIGAVVGLAHVLANHNFLIPASQGATGYSPEQLQRAFDISGAGEAGINGAGITVAIVGTGPISSADSAFLASPSGSGTLYRATLATITQVNVTDAGVATGLGLNSPTPNPGPTGVDYPYSSGFQPPPPVTAPNCSGGLPACNPEDGEAQLDSQTVAAMANGSNVHFYLGYNPNDCWQVVNPPQNNTLCAPGAGAAGEGIYESDPEIQQIIADDTADVVTMSYGGGEIFDELGGPLNNEYGYFDANGDGFGPIEFATMVSEGMAVFASSGDTGAYECEGYQYETQTLFPGDPKCVSYPASDPSVVSVGGVTAPLNLNGTLATTFTAWGYQSQLGGNGTGGNNIGSGGGVSTVFPATPWQEKFSDIFSLGGGMRTQPDISMMGDPISGPTVVQNAAFPGYTSAYGDGGTSLSAPMMASMWALVLQACKQDAVCVSKGSGAYPYRLGNPNPLMYGLYKTSSYGSAIFDVVYGNNGGNGPAVNPSPGASPPPPTPGPLGPGYSAGPGYDMVTGLGVPLAGRFIDAILTEEGDPNPAPIQ